MAIMTTLETTVDRFGRVVIPKRVRDDFGLAAGAVLQVEETAEGILLKPVGADWPLVVKDGMLVYGGRLIDELGDSVKRDRDERVRKVGGRSK